MGNTELFALLAGVFEVPVVDETFDVQDKWDSLVVLSAIAAIDEKFGFVVPAKELTETKSVADIVALIERSAATRPTS